MEKWRRKEKDIITIITTEKECRSQGVCIFQEKSPKEPQCGSFGLPGMQQKNSVDMI
ncbi:hypothetical protein DGMP_17570 [Desulfomarina profundi]|uniref:Uncharacterized protein n=1 Tax=Desulfomarina profundi TaxID=2772557 RepID=A0A8D5FMQ3_9BACT|nr:hypothetical protein DGMP_17570 [Desulfomarina profundi]